VPRVHGLLTLVLAAVALAGCGAQQSSSADEFTGTDREIAQVVDDFANAARTGDGEEICTRLVTGGFARELAAGNECKDEVAKAVSDANDFDLEVTDVTVSGTTARVEVRQGEEGEDARTATFELAREGRDWRLTSFGGSS
jgi:hypothetical protein